MRRHKLAKSATGPPPRPPPSPARPTRSVDFSDRVISRMNELSQNARSGLAITTDDISMITSSDRPADSMDSISLEPQKQLTSSPDANVWVRTSSGLATSSDAGSFSSTNPSPALKSRNPRVTTTGLVSSITMESPQTPPMVTRPVSECSGSPGAALSQRWEYTEVTALKNRFNALDREGKGYLNRSQFYQLIISILDSPDSSASSNSPMLQFAYKLFHSGGETLNLKEFFTGMTMLSRGSEEERIRLLFMMYDTANSGYLNAQQVEQVLRVMRCYAASQSFVPSESMESQTLGLLRPDDNQNFYQLAKETVETHDKDGDGRIGFEEFASWCSSEPIVKTWLDALHTRASQGVNRLREENERSLMAKELESLGITDVMGWETPTNVSSSDILPPSVRTDVEHHNPGDTFSNSEDSAIIGNTDQEQSTPTSTPTKNPSTPSRRPTHNRTLTQTAIDSFEIDIQDVTFHNEVGSGTFAQVWKCTWLDVTVAVKVFKSGPRLILDSEGKVVTQEGATGLGNPSNLNRYIDGDESFEPGLDTNEDIQASEDDQLMLENRRRFLQEVQLLKSIRHPNLLFYMGACVDPRAPLCIVAELIMGGSLYDCLHGRQRTSFTLQQKVALIHDIARGMLYLHGRDPIVLHRDLKSANILVEQQNDGSYKAMIIDFGLSKFSTAQASQQPGNGGFTGSLITMAPEIMRNERYCRWSDVYSFGMVVWEIFCERIPFGRSATAMEIWTTVSIRGERPPIHADDIVPAGIKHLITSCWDQEKERRPDFPAIVTLVHGIRKELGMARP